jgi:hypothetical protein
MRLKVPNWASIFTHIFETKMFRKKVIDKMKYVFFSPHKSCESTHVASKINFGDLVYKNRYTGNRKKIISFFFIVISSDSNTLSTPF